MGEARSKGRRRPFNQGEIIQVEVERLIPKGGSVAHLDGFPLRVQAGVPGDVLEVRVTHTGKNASWAKLRTIVSPSPERVDAPCPVMQRCGGCPWQTASLSLQQRARGEQLASILAEHLGESIPEPIWRTAEVTEGYRTRATMILRHRGGDLRMGFYAPGTQDIVGAEPCVVQHPTLNRVLEEARATFEELGLSTWRSAERPGLLRALSGRIDPASESVYLTIVLSSWDEPTIRHLGNLLIQIEGVIGVAANINPKPSGPILSTDTRPIVGEERQALTWGDLTMEIGPTSFTQTRHDAAEAMVAFVANALPDEMEHLVDLYSGVGMLGLSVQGRANRLTCVEQNPGAISDANHYLEVHGLQHVTMRRAKVVDVVDDVLADGADAVIIDPPRSGCPKPVLSALIAHEVPRVIYVSCGTHALGRDIPQLVSQGYVITQVAYFDMFPHTPHAEVVVSLEFQGAP